MFGKRGIRISRNLSQTLTETVSVSGPEWGGLAWVGLPWVGLQGTQGQQGPRITMPAL